MMPDFVCHVCGVAFNGDDGCHEVKSKVLPWFTEYEVSCPACGSQHYSPAHECQRCGGAFREEDLRGGYYCDDCLNEMMNQYHLKLYAQENADDFAEWMHERRVHRAEQT